MFDFVRNNKRVLQLLLLLLIIPSFVLVGVESYQDRGDSANGVASVDGRNITQQEWDDAQRRQIDEARAQMAVALSHVAKYSTVVFMLAPTDAISYRITRVWTAKSSSLRLVPAIIRFQEGVM